MVLLHRARKASRCRSAETCSSQGTNDAKPLRYKSWCSVTPRVPLHRARKASRCRSNETCSSRGTEDPRVPRASRPRHGGTEAPSTKYRGKSTKVLGCVSVSELLAVTQPGTACSLQRGVECCLQTVAVQSHNQCNAEHPRWRPDRVEPSTSAMQ
ncbi:UNVERIFIED_CONTAM: hypothetical protein FKN15_046592 [Acipenser sinensis]